MWLTFHAANHVVQIAYSVYKMLNESMHITSPFPDLRRERGVSNPKIEPFRVVNTEFYIWAYHKVLWNRASDKLHIYHALKDACKTCKLYLPIVKKRQDKNYYFQMLKVLITSGTQQC